jgi:hypothetical protein
MSPNQNLPPKDEDPIDLDDNVSRVAPPAAGTGHNRCPPLDNSKQPSWLELHRIVSLQEAAKLKSISVDTLKRRHADKIIVISPRRRGMRLRDALGL